MDCDIRLCDDVDFPSWSLFEFSLKPNTVKYGLFKKCDSGYEESSKADYKENHQLNHDLRNREELWAYALIDEEHDIVGHFLQVLEVREDCRHQGGGTKLLQFLCQKYKSIWFEPRNASHNFYLKQGAKPFVEHSSGWIFAINDRLPSENWNLFCEGKRFGPPPDDNFIYDPTDWDVEFLEMFA